MELANCVECGERLSDEVAAAGLTRCTPCSAHRLGAATAEPSEATSTMTAEGKQCPRCGKPATLDQLRCRACSFLWSKEDPTQPNSVYTTEQVSSLPHPPHELPEQSRPLDWWDLLWLLTFQWWLPILRSYLYSRAIRREREAGARKPPR